MNGFGKSWYLARWAFDTRVLRKHVPVNCSLILTGKCNLACKHCCVGEVAGNDPSFQDVKISLRELYRTGARYLAITGGEPALWEDHSYRLADVIECARELGFFRVIVCTNGLQTLDIDADYLWVSLDGDLEHHEQNRGRCYEKIVGNIEASQHSRIYCNYTITRLNYLSFEHQVDAILRIKGMRGVLLHIFTPYVGADRSLLLEDTQRSEVLRRVLAYKLRHPFKVVNTLSAIRALISDRWPRPIWGSVTSWQNRLSECCCRDGLADDFTCRYCGSTVTVETYAIQACKPLALLENLRFF